MNIRVVAPCTGKKTVRGPFLDMDGLRRWHEGTLPDAAKWPLIPAARLYGGLSHKRLMQGIDAYRAAGAGNVELHIVSAGMGMVDENTLIPPYEATFTGMRPAQRERWAERLGIPQRMADLMARPADLRLVLLGHEYLEVTRLSKLPCPVPTIVLAAPSAAGLVPPGALHVALGQAHAARFHHTLVALKGELARRVLAAIVRRRREGADVRELPAWRDAEAFLELCEENP